MARKSEDLTDAVDSARARWEAAELPRPAAMAAMVSLLRAQQIVLARVETVLKPLGLNLSRNQVLQILAMSPTGALRLSPISVQLLVHPTTITVVVDQLEKAGLVSRKPHPTDRRSILAEITPAGRAVAEKANQLMIDVNFGMPETVAEKDLDRLSTLLKLVRDEQNPDR